MPLLLGIIGSTTTSLEKQRISSFAHTLHNSTILHNESGFICAGSTSEQAHLADRIIPLSENSGMIVGKLFDRQTSQPTTPTLLETQLLIQNPKLLFKNWWGRYITVLYNKQERKHTLIRDPQGLSTLFYVVRPGSVVFSTNMGCLYDTLEEKPSVDLDYFAEYITNKEHASEKMPFEGVTELLPGMALHIYADGSVSHEQLWDIEPLRGSFITDTKQFEEELLTILRSSVKAWAHGNQNICVELSGGADSTAVMLLLRDVCPDANIIAVNYFDSKTPSSNEVEYAQEVANMCGAPLQLIDWQDVALTDPLPAGWRPDKPSTMFLFPKMAQTLHDIGTQHGCTEFMNGQGGDHVFLAPQPTEALADYWLDRGFRGITIPLTELSAAHRMPWTSLTQTALHDIAQYYGKKKKTITEPTPFLNSTFASTVQKQSSYVDQSIKKFYPGKITHIQALHHAVAYAERNRNVTQQLITTHPLLSQPIVELALQVPTYQSFAHGFDRILFRNAVSRIKKPKALWRTIKGQTTGSMTKMLSKDAHFIHDRLVDGTLVTRGMLNKQWLEKEIINIRHGKIENLWTTIHLFTAQQWLHQWKL
jgi:asparagine synthase (glutamine-hydrolysing)